MTGFERTMLEPCRGERAAILIAYYERAEPSSPIPLLIRRSKRLVSASFMDIVRDIASDGLTQVENLRGKEDGSNSS